MKIRISFFEFNADIASSGFLVMSVLEIINVFSTLSDIINSTLSPTFNSQKTGSERYIVTAEIDE